MSEFLSTSAVWGVMLTMGAFALGSWLHRRTGKAWMNPLLLGSIFVVVLLSVLGIPYQDYKASAAAGKLPAAACYHQSGHPAV